MEVIELLVFLSAFVLGPGLLASVKPVSRGASKLHKGPETQRRKEPRSEGKVRSTIHKKKLEDINQVFADLKADASRGGS